jgi:hypothetical protein
MERGERLRVSFDPVQDDYLNTYVAFYNSASFPVSWCQVRGGNWLSTSFEDGVAHAVRRVKVACASRGGAAIRCECVLARAEPICE